MAKAEVEGGRPFHGEKVVVSRVVVKVSG